MEDLDEDGVPYHVDEEQLRELWDKAGAGAATRDGLAQVWGCSHSNSSGSSRLGSFKAWQQWQQQQANSLNLPCLTAVKGSLQPGAPHCNQGPLIATMSLSPRPAWVPAAYLPLCSGLPDGVRAGRA